MNFNLDRRGCTSKGQFLCLAPEAGQAVEWLDAACRTLPVTMDYARD